MRPRSLWWGALPSAFALSLLSCATESAVAPAGRAIPTSARTVVSESATVVITEVMPDPSRVTDALGEWFELFNGGAEAVDLSGWRITSGPTGSETHVIARSVIVPAGGYAVLGVNADSATNGGVAVNYSYGSAITLNNSNTDWLTLQTPSGTLVDSVAYAVRTNGTPGSYSPPTARSRAVIDANVDNTIISGSNWTTSTATYGAGDFGTPGSGPYTSIIPAGPVVSVTVSAGTVNVGGTRPITATALDSAGRNASTTFTWASSAPAVATIDPGTGLATGVSAGVTTITATADNGVAGSAELQVAAAGGVASVSVSINLPAHAPVGFTKPAFPTARDGNGAVISPAPEYVWSSSDPTIATVDPRGYVTAFGVGTVDIRATTANGTFGTARFTAIPASVATSAIYRNHVEFGTPTDATPGDEQILQKPQYVLSYNSARGGANWVSWNLNATQFGQAPRCDCFSADLTLPAAAYHVVDFDYRNSGYDRGHMVQSESRTTSDQENAATFLLTNILPQAGENNQGPWSRLENHLNDLVRDSSKEVYVVAGGRYAPTPPTLKNEGRVAIPDYTWKVAVILDRGEGLANVASARDLRVVAVRMPNLTTASGPASAVGIRTMPWENYATTVDSIEALTGYDLLSALPDEIEAEVEGPNSPPQVVSLRLDPAGAALTVSGKACGGRYTACVRFAVADMNGPGDAPFTTQVDWGDNTPWLPNMVPHAGVSLLAPHDYAAPGSYVVRVTATDRRGVTTSSQTISLSVAP